MSLPYAIAVLGVLFGSAMLVLVYTLAATFACQAHQVTTSISWNNPNGIPVEKH